MGVDAQCVTTRSTYLNQTPKDWDAVHQHFMPVPSWPLLQLLLLRTSHGLNRNKCLCHACTDQSHGGLSTCSASAGIADWWHIMHDDSTDLYADTE